jgi:hypothetical protein
MPDERCPGDFLEADYASIELRVLAFYNTPQQAARAWHAEAKEECLNALMTPTGRCRRD